MMRSCEECKYAGMTFDDRLGEWVCDVCGYIQVENFEETIMAITYDGKIIHNKDNYYGLGSDESNNNRTFVGNRAVINYRKNRNFDAINEGWMILSEFTSSPDIRLEFKTNYNSLQKNHVFRGNSIIERCAGLSYFTLKDNNIRVDVGTLSKITEVPKKKIIRMAKKVASHFGKSHVLYQYNPEADIDKVRHELDLSFAFAEDVRRVYYALANNLGDLLDTKRKRFMAGVIWLTLQIRGETGRNKVSMESLAMALKNNKSKATVSYGYSDILSAIRLNRKMVEKITIEQLIEGAW